MSGELMPVGKRDLPDLVPDQFEDLLPKDVEMMMRYLTRELSETRKALAQIREQNAEDKATLSVCMAKSRDRLAGERREDNKSFTEQQREDKALIENEDLYRKVQINDALVDIYKGKIEVLKAQSDLVRSINVSVRTSMENE